ncbi:Smr/MutS family protein [Aliiroseovarius sp.]|uniref:Smr/MutS family protein n=1 Tax=Aliiroseovarius sp. TaxID=1872442 RepID=UPI00263680B4|nr:Smr/MutS family protein [Aliiroseovarius sp.]
MARKPRHLSPAERELWQKATSKDERLHPARVDPVEKLAKPPANPARPVRIQHPQFRVGQAAKGHARPHDIAPAIADQIARHPVQMDRKTFGKMRKGRLAPEARIDLHGMTIAEAHPELTGFILRAVARNFRLVLVITGKGKKKDEGGPIPVRHGVLRHQVPHWLNTMPLKPHVLQISEAHLKHGGGGAYYVYLRRRKG